MVKKQLKNKYTRDYIEAPENLEELIKALKTKSNIVVGMFIAVLAL